MSTTDDASAQLSAKNTTHLQPSTTTGYLSAVSEEVEAKPKSTKKKAKRPLPVASSRFRGFWIVVAGAYLVTVWLDGVGSNFPAKITPRPWLYFAQVAALFVTAAPKVIDYRAEGWSCSERKWIELDVRPYFRIDAENKENRFQRTLQFYRRNRIVLRALEDFLVKRNAASGGPMIGGLRFSSLRLPYPAPGEHVAPYQRLPLAGYPSDLRHDWYWTPKSRRIERCGQKSEPSDGSHDDDSERPRDSDPKEVEP